MGQDEEPGERCGAPGARGGVALTVSFPVLSARSWRARASIPPRRTPAAIGRRKLGAGIVADEQMPPRRSQMNIAVEIPEAAPALAHRAARLDRKPQGEHGRAPLAPGTGSACAHSAASCGPWQRVVGSGGCRTPGGPFNAPGRAPSSVSTGPICQRNMRRLRSGGRIVEQRCRNREQKDNEAQEAQITQKIANDTE
jgi:hypothetical protein